MNGTINMNGQSISGLNDPTEATQAARKEYVDAAKAESNAYTDAVVRKAAPRNLLDNSDFRNPVNQRGQTSYSGSGYTIDRWKSDIGGIDITVENGCVSLLSSGTYNLAQDVSDYKAITGKTITFALRYDGDITLVIGYYANGAMQYRSAESVNGLAIGTAVIPDNAESITFFIQTKASIKTSLYWAALYEGSFTAETLPEYRPQGYMVEALNCGALHVTTTATLSTSWSGSGPYTQTVAISGILASDMPHVTPVLYADAYAVARVENWQKISMAEAVAGGIKFTCFEEKPMMELGIQIEVMR